MIVALVAVVGGCTAARPAATQAALRRLDESKFIMGMWVRLVIYAPDDASASAAADAAFRRIIEIDRICSDYKIDSELNRLCGRAGQGPQAISEDLFRVLEKAQELAERTDGAFDITAGPLVRLWRKARQEKRLPDEQALRAARALVGWKNLRLDARARTADLRVAGMRLDLGAIAKGYAGDCAIAVLRERGIRSALFEAGGDIVIGDAPPGQAGWEVDVPFPASATQPTSVLRLANCGVSVSGDLNQFVEIAGRRYSHVVDPRTGLGLSDRLMALVIAPDGMSSDSLSTALTLVGQEKAAKLVQSYPHVLYRLTIAH